MLGRPVEEAIGKAMEELFPPDLAKSIVNADKKILDEGVMKLWRNLKEKHITPSSFQ